MASPSVTYTFTNGTTADATQVNQNFTDLVNGLSDGTKDLSISALTAAGNVTLNGNVTIGNATSDDITVTGSLASSIPVKATRSHDIGTADLGLRTIYMGANSPHTVGLSAPSSGLSGDVTFSLPPSNGTAFYILKTDGSGNTSWVPPSPSAATGSDADTTLTVASSRSQVVTPTANRNYTLPTTSVLAGDMFTFVNNATVASDLRIIIKSSDGDTVRTVYPQTSAQVMALQDTPTDATHWMGIGVVESEWTAFTPTGSLTGNVTYTGMKKRSGDMLFVEFKMSATSTPTPSVTFTTTLPDSLTINTGKWANTTANTGYLGWGSVTDSGTAEYFLVAQIDTSTTINYRTSQADGTYTKGGVQLAYNNPVAIGNSDYVVGNYAVPISGWSTTKG